MFCGVKMTMDSRTGNPGAYDLRKGRVELKCQKSASHWVILVIKVIEVILVKWVMLVTWTHSSYLIL